MLLWSNDALFLIQVISGGGIPVAEQVKVTGSFSFTVYVKPSSTGKVMLGMTGGGHEQFYAVGECDVVTHNHYTLNILHSVFFFFTMNC